VSVPWLIAQPERVITKDQNGRSRTESNYRKKVNPHRTGTDLKSAENKTTGDATSTTKEQYERQTLHRLDSAYT